MLHIIHSLKGLSCYVLFYKKYANIFDKTHFTIVVSSTYYVALALPWTLTVMRGIQVPRNSKAACVDRFPLTPPVPGPPCAAPWVPEPEPPGPKVHK